MIPRHASGTRRPVLLELAVANSLASQVFVRELLRAGYPPTQVGMRTLIEIHGRAAERAIEEELGVPIEDYRGPLERLRKANRALLSRD